MYVFFDKKTDVFGYIIHI